MVAASQGTRQDRVDRPGAGGERLGVLEAWRGEAVPCTRGLVVLPENHQPRARRDEDGSGCDGKLRSEGHAA